MPRVLIQMAAETANEIAREEERLERLKENFHNIQESIAEKKEEITDVVANWFSENELEPDAILTTVQKNLLDRALYFLKQEEEILTINTKMVAANIRNVSRSLRHLKDIRPTDEEKAQEDAEVAAERRFYEISQRIAIPQYFLEDLYERSEYEIDLISFWNEQTERCKRIALSREKEMREPLERM